MFWSFIPLIVVLIVFFFASRMNLGNFPAGGNGYVKVPEGLFVDFSLFITVVLLIIIPLGVAATLANFKLGKYKEARSWYVIFSREVWVTIQVFTGIITFLFLVVIQVFKS